jgi:hypothetical protein
MFIILTFTSVSLSRAPQTTDLDRKVYRDKARVLSDGGLRDVHLGNT